MRLTNVDNLQDELIVSCMKKESLRASFGKEEKHTIAWPKSVKSAKPGFNLFPGIAREPLPRATFLVNLSYRGPDFPAM